MASGKDFETLHAMYKNITEQLQAKKHQTKSPSISNFRPYESSHMERSTDLKGRHMLLSTTIRDTLMFTSYSSCPSLASALLGLCSHGSKGKRMLVKNKDGYVLIREKDHPDYNVVYRDFMDEGSATRLNRSLSSDSKWSYNVLSSREKSKDENIGGKGESMAGRRSSDFIGSSTTVSGEPGSLLSLPMGLSLTSLNRRSSFNKSCNTLMNRWTFYAFSFTFVLVPGLDPFMR